MLLKLTLFVCFLFKQPIKSDNKVRKNSMSGMFKIVLQDSDYEQWLMYISVSMACVFSTVAAHGIQAMPAIFIKSMFMLFLSKYGFTESYNYA